MATKKKLLQAAAGNAGGDALNVEDVFSTYLYTGTGADQTITNGIDLSGEGGMTWIKRRNAADNHQLTDSERGYGQILMPNSTFQNQNLTSLFNLSTTSSGFTIGSNNSVINNSGSTYASWTFRKAPKFFTCLTYTGDGVAGREISHNLGSVPGFIIVKKTNASGDWIIQHRSLGAQGSGNIRLNSTDAAVSNGQHYWGNGTVGINPTSSVFTVDNHTWVNNNGDTYVAYLFAHNDGDGEFGPDADADIIKCGSYTGNGSGTGPTVNLGFEPQWLLIKNSSASSNWTLFDNMRGLGVPTLNTGYNDLNPNLSNAEAEGRALGVTATGFQIVDDHAEINGSSNKYIYIAIRRGTAVPTSATEVFGISYAQNVNAVPFPVDFMLNKIYGGGNTYARDRLRGGTKYLLTETTNADLTGSDIGFDDMTGNTAVWGTSFINYNWKRAFSYMDCVAYTGTGSARTVSHNLGVAPEMIWVKERDNSTNWGVYHTGLNGGTTPQDYFIRLNLSGAEIDNFTVWNDTAPTDTQFTVGLASDINGSNDKYIAYLFATLAGISKVGSVTHSGTTNVDCGFTSGARFVLLKRTDATGDWYVWDSARGIVSGNDPYLLLNSTAAEVTNTDYIDPLSSGFTITSSFTAGDYIFYAVS